MHGYVAYAWMVVNGIIGTPTVTGLVASPVAMSCHLDTCCAERCYSLIGCGDCHITLCNAAMTYDKCVGGPPGTCTCQGTQSYDQDCGIGSCCLPGHGC